MEHLQPFLQQVREHPHDDTPRLILADFLEELGEPQGELIRVQIALAGLAPLAPGRRALELRQRELLDAHGERWLQPLRALGVEGLSSRCFRRGLIERVRVRAEVFLEHAAAICDVSPAIHTVDLRHAGEVMEQLVEFTLPAQIRTLDLSSSGLGRSIARDSAVTIAQTLAEAPWLEALEGVELQFNQLGAADLRALIPCFSTKLKSLGLSVNQLGPRGCEPLAEYPLAGLEVLQLKLNHLGFDGLAALAAASLPRLRELDLASNNVGDLGVGALIAWPVFDCLRRLNLRANSIGLAGMLALQEALRERSAPLELDLRNNGSLPLELQELLT